MLIWEVEASYAGLRNPRHVQLTGTLLVLVCRVRQITVGQCHLTLRQRAAGLFENSSLWTIRDQVFQSSFTDNDKT